MMLVMATAAAPLSLMQMEIFLKTSTMAALFAAGKIFVYLNKGFPIPFAFILQESEKYPPACISNFTRECFALKHLFDAQVLYSNHLVFMNELGRVLVEKVKTLVLDFGMESANTLLSFCPIIRSFGLEGEVSLSTA